MIIYEEVIREFQKQRVKYIVVGGIAVNLHGGLRNTFDLDILVEFSPRNLNKLVKILRKQGYKMRQPVDAADLVDREKRTEWLTRKNMKAFNFYRDRDLKEVDIIIDSPLSYETARRKMSHLKLGRLRLPLISIDHLIRMKQKAGRPLDRLDVADLKQIKKLQRKK